MNPYYDKDSITLYCGDLLDVLPQLTEKIDHVVTDPPYGLSFMGRGWDHAVPGPEYWKIISDACKPGALMMAFGGTRTYHRLTCAIEDAGWDIRDCLMWLYGSGFPKAQDVGKMLDKAAGVIRTEVVREGVKAGTHPDGDVYAKGLNVGFQQRELLAPVTDDAKAWTGYANALKPAYEPIVLAMKAMDGTIAHNALTHGVAGMNIGDCRIGTETRYNPPAGLIPGGSSLNLSKVGMPQDAVGQYATGRWPANVLLQHHPDCKQIGTQTSRGDQRGDCNGHRPSGFANVGADSGDSVPNARVYGNEEVPIYECHPDCPVGLLGDKSRFFYCAKASKKERGQGNVHPTVKPFEVMRYLLTLLSTPTGGVILDPFAGSGTTLLAAQALGRRCIGVELNQEYCDIIASRLEAQ